MKNSHSVGIDTDRSDRLHLHVSYFNIKHSADGSTNLDNKQRFAA